MTDIVERLRACPGVKYGTDPECNCAEAADEIERLRARVSQLVSQLDEQYGTPCEQIRHQQEIDRLREEVETWKSHYDGERRDHEATLKAWQEERSGL